MSRDQEIKVSGFQTALIYINKTDGLIQPIRPSVLLFFIMIND